MILADDADAAGIWRVEAQKEISFDQAAIAMPQRKRALATLKGIRTIDVVARLVGDDLTFTIALFEVVVFDERFRESIDVELSPTRIVSPPFLPRRGRFPK